MNNLTTVHRRWKIFKETRMFFKDITSYISKVKESNWRSRTSSNLATSQWRSQPRNFGGAKCL